ncbi:TetR/AcrR family transcriptional regulator [Duganella callida]|uniref:TetR/AcrR family transcriptional regulator n=1 Tax=Duganella callida TaxID=2561932 RepID=A0A4Y9S8B9_9BURK|nr:TetR/AcrR family transcriptional regulator [Duganella callida]TFW16732.1 TetR/AcrR family transcriptional regulator [Duganella callida]
MNKLSSTADEILACAQSLIVAGGYNGFSYADIAEVVGVRKPSIHHHFPSKVDLVKTLVSRYRAAAEEGAANMAHALPGPQDQLQAYVGYWKRCIEDASAPFCVCALLAVELPVLPEEVALEIRAYFRFLSDWLTSLFERGAREGVLRLRETPHVEAEAFMATVHGAMLSARAFGNAGAFAAVMDPMMARLTAVV